MDCIKIKMFIGKENKGGIKRINIIDFEFILKVLKV